MRIFEGYTKGVNLGGWLSQCKHSIMHYDTFITEKDVALLSTWGIDHLRVPIDFEVLETPEGNYIESGFAYIDACLSWCEKYHLNMILDLHKTAGYSFDKLDELEGFFVDAALQERYLRLWEQFALRYGHISDRLVFELLNEVVSPKVIQHWNQIAHRAIVTIRAIAPDIRIILGGIWNNSAAAIKYLDMPYDKNILYTFHCYDPLLFTHQSAYWLPGMPSDFVMNYPATMEAFISGSKKIGEELSITLQNMHLNHMGTEYFEAAFAEAIQIASERDVALYCGEYGVIDRAPLPDSIAWLRDIHAVLDKHKIGRAIWSYKKMDFGITDEHYAPIFEEIISLL